jgi:hypothetical protein
MQPLSRDGRSEATIGRELGDQIFDIGGCREKLPHARHFHDRQTSRAPYRGGRWPATTVGMIGVGAVGFALGVVVL